MRSRLPRRRQSKCERSVDGPSAFRACRTRLANDEMGAAVRVQEYAERWVEAPSCGAGGMSAGADDDPCRPGGCASWTCLLLLDTVGLRMIGRMLRRVPWIIAVALLASGATVASARRPASARPNPVWPDRALGERGLERACDRDLERWRVHGASSRRRTRRDRLRCGLGVRQRSRRGADRAGRHRVLRGADRAGV